MGAELTVFLPDEGVIVEYCFGSTFFIINRMNRLCDQTIIRLTSR